jgi:diguanylate cyclase
MRAADGDRVSREDGFDQATTIAEQSMARMAAERVPPTPENFALWYAHYSGRAPELSRSIGMLEGGRQDFTRERTEELYDRFVGNSRETEAVRAAGETIQAALSRLMSLMESHGDGTSRYGEALQDFSGRLESGLGIDQLRILLGTVVAETSGMLEQNRALQTQLSNAGEQLAELRRNLDSVRRQAITDGLTGLFNRKHFDEVLTEAAGRASAGGRPLSLLMIDIDFFKKFNDQHGHTVGDHVLALVARTLSECISPQDTAARYGGEEFAIVAPGLRAREAAALGERIRETVASKRVVNRARNQSLGTITLSVGVAVLEPGEVHAALVQRADGALYAAKRQGRNRVVVAAGGAAGRAASGAGGDMPAGPISPGGAARGCSAR